MGLLVPVLRLQVGDLLVHLGHVETLDRVDDLLQSRARQRTGLVEDQDTLAERHQRRDALDAELAGFTKTLQAYGMRRVEDQRERYRFRVTSRADAELVLSALYLPQTRWSRVEAAIELLQDRVERKGSVDITIPMRRVVAIK